jgi:hypothetical protein
MGRPQWVIEKTVTNKDQEVVESDKITWPAKHSVEKGGNQWAFTKTVTEKTPPGKYLCEDISVSDAYGNKAVYERDMRFLVAKDGEEPDIQEVRISVARP